MKHKVYLTRHAARDLEELHEFIEQGDSTERADHVLGKIDSALQGLSASPDRGTRPRELLALGLRSYRQVFFKPYRIIYTVHQKNVYVMLIADGRRDMESLLQRRLLDI